MPAQQGQTDEILKVTLTSKILGARWVDGEAAAGGKAAYEVKTQYVGDGAPIKVTFKDLEGKTLSTLEGTVLSNLHRGLFTASAANATGGVTFEAELPKHGLKAAGGRLRTGKPIEFSAMRFTDPEGKKALTELPEGEPAACEAKVRGLKEGDKVLVSVHLRTDWVMQDGHLFVEGEVPVKDGKVMLLFTPKVKTRLDAIRIQAELDKEGGTYFQPEYVFACRAGGVRVVSEPAKAVQELVLNFWEFPGQAGNLEGKQVTLTGPDGKKDTKTIPKDGTIVIKDAKPGNHRLTNLQSPFKQDTSAPTTGGTWYEGMGAISFEDAKDIALQVTEGFEGHGYDGIAGNFDNAGISFGIIQWNFGKETLPPLFRKFLAADKDAFRNCFGGNDEHYHSFLSILSKPKADQMNWALGIQEKKTSTTKSGKTRTTWSIHEPWLGYLKNLATEPKFQVVQKEAALGPYPAAAREIIAWLRKIKPAVFGRISLRMYACLYDLCVQQGGLGKKSNRESAKALITDAISEDPYEILKILTDHRGSAAEGDRGRWRADSVSRRHGILSAKPVKVVREDLDGRIHEATRTNAKFSLLVPDKLIGDY